MLNKDIHFQRRLGFGVPLAFQKTAKQSRLSFENLLSRYAREKSIEVTQKPEFDPSQLKNLSEENLKKIVQRTRQETLRLNYTWMEQMVKPECSIREKMTFFWHDHFACRSRVAYLAQQQNNTIRKNALGSFAHLLMNVSKDPAMIQFLNNQQNKKDSPNENFAREVMELFTLGRGNYTEEDVKNAARAFTGWAFDPRTGTFIFRPRVHDDGMKTFRGKRGNFKGEDIVDMLLSDRQTARFITEKIWTFFVSTAIKDEKIITALASDFYQSGYDLHKLMKSIYASDWFYEDRFVGNRIKSPVELLAGIQLHTQGVFQDELSLAFVQRAMGQVLFFPPNVGGWPQGKEWIDSSSLTFRLSLPGILLKGEGTDFQTKDDGDVNNLTNSIGKSKISFVVNWEVIAHHFVKDHSADALEEIESFLLPRPTRKENRALIEKYTAVAQGDIEFIKRAYTGFMSLPEYQLS